MANAKNDPAPAPNPDPEPDLGLSVLDSHTEADADPRDPADATDVAFFEDDADERGWLVYREPPNADGVQRYHRVPVAHWSQYEKLHGF